MHPAVLELLRHPDAQLVVDEAIAVLEAEKKARLAFYEQISPNDKAEFINGQIVWHSPVRLRHNDVGSRLFMLIRLHVGKSNSGIVGFEKLMIELTRNSYEPDICFFRKEVASRFTPDQMLFPAPDLVVEVLSPSTETTDRTIKFQDYQRHGIHEYWIVDPEIETVEVFTLRDGVYSGQKLELDQQLVSSVLAGFSCPVRAAFDEAVFLETLSRL
jgi:Uma2 family endonuclease